MKLTTLITPAIAIVLSASIASLSVAAPVTPYTENFTTDAAQWLNGDSSGFADYVPSGGPDGSSYVSASLNTQTNAGGASRVVFRGNSTTTPSIHASGDKFAGDWLVGGNNHFSAWVYHEAPVALPYFARFATPGGFPGTAAIDGTLVQPHTWTQLNYIISPNQIGQTLTPEAMNPADNLAVFNQTFTNVGRVQIGFNVPASMANSPTSFIYGLDQVSVSFIAPEPASWLLALGVAGIAVIRRRRRDG